jgi:hypothetical protein
VKGTVVSYFELLSHHLLGRTEEKSSAASPEDSSKICFLCHGSCVVACAASEVLLAT